ncbi:Cof-type HAD-IIB family hydrolase [Paenibacillus sp. GCM10027629]|uniref:Cof-type HAD-IIB family hydrolase n=1 Tax=Paenibacillus sp. GCM10027629 TaxID=3273414 RepID=UPI00362B7EC0
MNRFQMIALDVDGTLINDHHEITPKTRESVLEVAKQGAEIVLCTGRNPSSTIPLLEQLGLVGTVITHNGAVTMESATRKIIHQYVIADSELAPFKAYCREHHYHFDLNTANELYVERKDILTEEVLAMYGKFYVVPLVLPVDGSLTDQMVKMTAFGTKEQMDELEAEWNTWMHELTIIRSGDYFIDIMHARASKGNALKYCAASREVDASAILAIGNYYNDITMLQFAGVGIAMDNSPIEVKAAADDITLSNNEDGVHLALVKYCL